MPGVGDMSMVWMGAGAGPGSITGPSSNHHSDHLLGVGVGGYPGPAHHTDNSCDLLLDSNHAHESPSYYTASASSHHSAASNQSLDDMSTHMTHHSPLAPLEGLSDIHLSHHHLFNNHDGTDEEDQSYQDNGLHPHMMDTATQTAPCPAGGRKIKPVRHPGLVLKTPIAYERDTDPAVIPIVKDGIAVCEKCGAIGVKHAFYTRERRFCSLACARGYPGLLPSDHVGSTGNNSPSGGDVKNILPSQPDYAQHQFKMEYDEDYTGLIPDDPHLPQLPRPLSPPQPLQQPLNSPSNQQHLHHHQVLNAEDLIPPLPLVRRKHNTGQLANSWDWDPDLNRHGSKFNAASVLCFRNAPMRDVWEDIQAGMKVEVENTDCEGGGRELSVVDSFWVAMVIRVVGYKALLRYEGFGSNPCKDFWVSLCSNQVHPVGWCATRGKPLIPPKTIENKFSDWKGFLRKRLTGAQTLPSNYGLKVADNLRSRFRCGLQLEVVDKMRISQVKVAVVHKIVGKRLNVKYYDLPPDDAGFWCHEDSALLHPVGWAKKVGHNLVAPPHYPYHHHHPSLSPSPPTPNYATDDLFMPIQVGVADPATPQQQQTRHQHFSIGMKLEAIDPLNLSSICAATVMAVLRRGYIMIRIDMYEADLTGADWFCYHRTSPCIFPVGFCKANGIVLTPPKGYAPQLFTWDAYLRETGHDSVPIQAFSHHNQTVMGTYAFREGMKIEAADLMDPRLVCVGTIARVVGRLLKVHFDGWEDEYDQWLDCESPDIYPVGWCFSVGHKLEGPRVIPKLPNKQYLSPKGLKKRKKKKTSPNKTKDLNKANIMRISKSVGSDEPVDIMDIDEILDQVNDYDHPENDHMELTEPGLPQHDVEQTAVTDTEPSSPNIALNDRTNIDADITSNQLISDNLDSVWNSPVHTDNTVSDPVNVMTVTSTSNSNMTLTSAASTMDTASVVGVVSTTTTSMVGANVTAATPPPLFLQIQTVDEEKATSNVNEPTSPKVIPRIIDNMGAFNKLIAPDEWNVYDVAQFLRVNDCANYCDTFSKQKVDGTRLLNLNKEDILDYTGGKVGPSLKIYDLVQQLKIKINPSQSRHMKANIKKFL